MATRDLTTDYLRLRSTLHRQVRPTGEGEGARGSLIGAAAGSGADGVDTAALAASAPRYAQLAANIGTAMNALAGRMDDLAKAHDARLRISFDPEKEREEKERIDDMTAAITSAFRRIGRDIDLGFTMASEDAAERKLVHNVKRGLATRLQEQQVRFRGMQREYMGSMRRLAASSSIASLFAGSGGAGAAAGGLAEDRDTGFTEEQMHELATAEEDADERMREIQRIAKSVEELATMFRELNTLIVEQGTLLDRIDYNIEQTVERVQDGVKQLVVAEKYQKSARPICCMAILMVLIVICVIIIAVKTKSATT